MPSSASSLLLLLLPPFVTPHAPTPTSLGPVIALLMQPGLLPTESYVPASYVKWLELAGARVVPLSYHATDAEVDALFEQVNGALWSGGDGAVPPAARRLYTRAEEAYLRGDVFPIWGTCDGFEWLMQIAAEEDAVLTSPFDAWNISMPLNFTPAAPHSRALADAALVPVLGTSDRPRLTVLDALSRKSVTMNNHRQGVTPDDFRASSKLTSTFEILSTNRDRNGKEFVSFVEGLGGRPFWGTQWHPEKNIFEQGMQESGLPFEAMHHDSYAVAVSQYFANFFVGLCRGSTHKFLSPASESRALIYNYRTSTAMAPNFSQEYTIADSATAAS
ncbi:hypothetical protein AB1Y20_004141 [Prymnesium parvum]|uniref:folate gamma-glutamyl hydrolase n=1 Tax=Prymnesium parvum TaxID=97485 RepID=A0AB34J6L6_PRYPA